jgi:hypothetical protein
MRAMVMASMAIHVLRGIYDILLNMNYFNRIRHRDLNSDSIVWYSIAEFPSGGPVFRSVRSFVPRNHTTVLISDHILSDGKKLEAT